MPRLVGRRRVVHLLQQVSLPLVQPVAAEAIGRCPIAEEPLRHGECDDGEGRFFGRERWSPLERCRRERDGLASSGEGRLL